MKTILVDAAKTFVVDGKINAEMYNLLESYLNLKIILSNASKDEFTKYGLLNLPYQLYTLEHNPDKTDPKYFQRMFEDLNLNKDNVVYFEHTPQAVESAKSLGIVSHFYDCEKPDLVELKKFLDENV